MEHFPQQPIVHREACDECHQRKVRCVTGNGACQNCILWGKSCIFSPRSSMGRPRKRKAVKSDSNSANRTLPTAETGSFDSNVNNQVTQQERHTSSSSSSTSHSSQFGIPTAADYLPTPPITTSDPAADYLTHGALNHFSIQDTDFNVILDSDWYAMTDKSNTNNNTTNPPSRSLPFMSTTTQPLGRPSPSDTVTIFSTMLFDLRRQRDRLYSKDPSATIILDSSSPPSPETHEIFRQVSTFCEVTQRGFSGIDPSSGQEHPPETQSMVHLVIMTISTALDIYGLQVRNGDAAMAGQGWRAQQMQQMQTTESSNTNNPAASQHRESFSHNSPASAGNPFWPAPPNPRAGMVAPPPQPTATSPRLPLIVHLTTIDYHLAQFQWILSRLLLLFPSPPSSAAGAAAGNHTAHGAARMAQGYDDGPAEELKKSQAETAGLRARIAEMVEGLKSRFGGA